MKDMPDTELFTETASSDKESEAREYPLIIDRNFFQLQRESRQIMKELPKRDEALRCYADIVKSARPELCPEGAVQKRG